jgi:serine/threonine-protein kinase
MSEPSHTNDQRTLALDQLIDQVCSPFEAALRATPDSTKAPRIEDYLSTAPRTEHVVILRELVFLEVHYRRLRGDSPQTSEYVARFPELDAPWLAEILAQPLTRTNSTGCSETIGNALPASSRLGPYEIIAPLGAGGMGEVYRARDTRLGREVAVKVLPQPLASDPDRRARFEREARAVAALSHPNILAIHDYGTQGAISYAVMELLEGETLRGRLAKGPLPWREAVEIGAAIADGLAAAHAKGIIHRDLKPENLFLTADGRVKILDFGLARMDPPADSQVETGPYVRAATDPGVVMGTAGYMSPEQVRGERVDARSDLFSFGCVLYEMVAGRRAFQRETAAETMTAILHEEPPEPATLGHPVPAELGRVIHQCLAKSPSHRLQSAHDLALGFRGMASDPTLHRLTATRRFSRRLAGAIATALLIGVLGPSVYFLTKGGSRAEPGKPSDVAKAVEALAVLPFVTDAKDSDSDFLGDGMTISLINSLSQVRDLKVRPYSSVTRHKSGQRDPLLAGRELQVQAVLTGRVQKIREDLIITVELVDVAEGRSLWIEQYQRKYVNLLAVQQEIARASTDKLRLRLSGEEAGQLARQPTHNLEAFRLYILGRVEWNKRTEEGLKRGIAYFEQSIQEDPNYALAYAGLADCHIILGFNHMLFSPREAFGKARSAAAKALEKDANLAEVYASLACIQAGFDWDWTGAERQFKRAIQLQPTYPTAHHWYALLLSRLGRHDEGLAEIRQTQKLDPSSLIINHGMGAALRLAHRLDDAIEQYRKTLAMEPTFAYALLDLGVAYAQKGMYPEAIMELQRAHQQSKRQTRILGFLGYAHAKAGQESQAREVLARLQDLAKHSYVSSYTMALIYLGLGDKDQAFACLHQALAERDPWLMEVKIEPLLDELRTDPRFTDLLRCMGLADKAVARGRQRASVGLAREGLCRAGLVIPPQRRTRYKDLHSHPRFTDLLRRIALADRVVERD